jgi:uncharacterized protein (TIGR02598 family)
MNFLWPTLTVSSGRSSFILDPTAWRRRSMSGSRASGCNKPRSVFSSIVLHGRMGCGSGGVPPIVDLFFKFRRCLATNGSPQRSCTTGAQIDVAGHDRARSSSGKAAQGAGNTHTGDGGFTLIEVLVSLTILSVSLAVLMGVFGTSLLRSREAQSRMQARRLAMTLLADAQSDTTLRMGETRGKDGTGLVWDLQVQPYGSPDDDQAWIAHAAQVRATVSWGGGGEEQSVSLATLRLLPKEISP